MWIFLYMGAINDKMFKELVDHDRAKNAAATINELIREGEQYSMIIIDTNARTKKLAGAWLYVDTLNKILKVLKIKLDEKRTKKPNAT